MTAQVPHPLLVGTYTTPARAKVVTELLDAMQFYMKPGDEVLVYNSIPAVYFLTQTHPWLGLSWPDFESAVNIQNLILQKEIAGTKLPRIVRAKASVVNGAWPLDPQILPTWWQQGESRRVFGEFADKHGYVLAWSNDFFEILIAPE
jgi:hypothetical protein